MNPGAQTETTYPVIWLYGLSGAGKTTTAYAVKKCIPSFIVLDTDELRPSLNADLGWGEAARMENVRRYAELAGVLSAQCPVIVACATPLRAQRCLVCEILRGRVCMVYLKCDLEVCKQRSAGDYYNRVEKDPKVTSLAGVNFPFEQPTLLEPTLTLDTGNLSVKTAVQCVTSAYTHLALFGR